MHNFASRPRLALRLIALFLSLTLISLLIEHLNVVIENSTLSTIAQVFVLTLFCTGFLLWYGEAGRRLKLRIFFRGIGFDDYCKHLPKYRGKERVNQYLVKITFRSLIHEGYWMKAQKELEMYFGKKIHKIACLHENIRIVEIYVIHKDLPKLIKWHDSYLTYDKKLFPIGEGFEGQVLWDLKTDPHGLIAGATSAGKTNLLRLILNTAIRRGFETIVFDFKAGGDFSFFGDIIISEPKEALDALRLLLAEVRNRMTKFRESKVTNVDEYNTLGQDELHRFLLVIDEAAEVFDVKPKEKDEKELYLEIDKIMRTLARMSRAAGVHMLFGMIRPDANVLDGQIKNNLSLRACGHFSDPAASRIVLDSDKATDLPTDVKGRFIIDDEEVQTYFLTIAGSEKSNS